jgi:hypothetical protein
MQNRVIAPTVLGATVVITAGEAIGNLRRAATSALLQTFSSRIILVIDKSQPEFVEGASGFALEVVIGDYARSLARMRNAGAAAATSEVLVFMSSDDDLSPTYVAEAISLINQVGGIVYSDYRNIDGAYVATNDFDFKRLLYTGQPNTCLAMLGSIWREIGGFRENVECHEDWDFLVAAALRGQSVTRLAKAHFSRLGRAPQSPADGCHATANRALQQIILNNPLAYPRAAVRSAKIRLGEYADIGIDVSPQNTISQ